MKTFPINKTIQSFNSVFNENGYSLYVVGGAVRDFLLGKENHDFDFCTDALPEQVIKIFNHVVPTGIKHGTVTVLFKDCSFEVTTFRTEGKYSDKRHPDEVSFVSNLEEDLSRRDFTINAFAADCRDGRIIDLFDGEKDLKNGLVRAIGEAEKRFEEDALRLMRMCRFCSKLNFEAESLTFEAAKNLSSSMVNVSQERICDELFKILMTEKPSVGICLMEKTGLLDKVLPELSLCRTIVQDKVGSSDVLGHILNCTDAAAGANYSLEVRLSALLHDIGKPSTMTSVNGFLRFYGHDVKSAQLAEEVCKRLKCSTALITKVKILIEGHMIKYTDNWTDGAVKRFINKVGKDNIEDLFHLQWCDQIASEGVSKQAQYKPFIDRIAKSLEEPLTLKDLCISGDDLASIGIEKGPKMGRILNTLLEMVIDYPNLNEKSTLLRQAELLK